MKLDRLIYGFSLVGLLGFYSCSSEDGLMQNNPVKGEQMPLTITVNRGEAGTRTILSENKANGGLTSKWEDGDQLHVYSSTGKDLGTLTIQSGQETSVGVFSGTIDKVTDGQFVSLFYYNLIEGMVSVEEASIGNYLKIDVSEQEFKSVSALSKLDILTSANPNYEDTSDEATVQLSVSADNSVTVKRDVTLQSKLAFARFSMKNLPTGAKGTLYITDVNDKLYVSHGLNFNSCERTQENTSPNGIKITNVEAGEDVYVALIPSYNSAVPNYTLKFKFVNDKDNKVYTYQFTKPTKIEAGKYYNTFTEGADGQDGTIDGFAINFSEDQSGSDPDYPGYENEDPRNPLHKFAKYNLTRDENNLNVFVDDDKAYGALYQWGRYFGFIDNKDKFSSTRYSLTSNSYIQFAEAIGYRNNSGTTDTWEYSVYDPDGDGQIYNIASPDPLFPYAPIVVGFNHYPAGNEVYYDYPKIYNLKSHLALEEPFYMMPGEPGTLIGLYRMGNNNYVDEYANSGDYWAEAFGVGGSTWKERAKNQGFAEDKLNPCPDGWRLPSAAEMNEIIPENGLYEPNGNLASMVKDYCELRKTEDGVNYVIRWNYVSTNNYVEIEAVVVDDSYTSVNQITPHFWDNHKTDKVVRIFPFTGGIRPFTGIVYGSTAFDTFICRPISMGAPRFDTKSVRFGWAYGILVTLNPNETGSVNNHFGGYWVSEKDQAVKFCAANFEREVNGNIHPEASEYTRIRMEETGPAFGMAIRPVMDK